MCRLYRLLLSVTLVVIMLFNFGFVMLLSVSATKGSYRGTNGKIAFEATPSSEQDMEIYVMNPNGSGITRLTSNNVLDSAPCWSPDGSKIVYSSGDSIWVMDSDGSNQKQLTTPPEDNYDIDPAWSPDGSKIAFIRNYVGGAAFVYYLYVMGADGSTPARLLPDEYYVYHPSWSPDGSKLVVGIDPDLALVNPSSDTVIAKTSFGGLEFSADDPCWSPDGSRIAFTREYHSTGDTEVCVIKGDLKGTPTLLVEDGKEPNWYPDGTKIVFARIPYSIWIMNSDGSDASDLTPEIPGAEDPDYQSIPLRELPVAGIVTPKNRLQILAPYLVLAGLIIAVSVIMVIRKR